MLSLEKVSRKGLNPYIRPIANLLARVAPTAAIVATERNTLYPNIQAMAAVCYCAFDLLLLRFRFLLNMMLLGYWHAACRLASVLSFKPRSFPFGWNPTLKQACCSDCWI
jgi:hypothetical protein